MSTVFKTKKLADPTKLRGGYYTPEKLADFLSEWAIRSDGERVLEPSCGDGNFLVSAQRAIAEKRVSGTSFTAVEVFEQEISKAKARYEQFDHPLFTVEWINQDFFRAFSDLKKQSYDTILGNPPFIRFQYFEDESRDIAFGHLRDAGYHPNKLANSWAAFVQLSIELLSPGGRLAMVVPAELLQVKYAGELRTRITQAFNHVCLVTFKKLVFPEIQQEVILLLAEGKRETLDTECDLHTVEIVNDEELHANVLTQYVAHHPAKHARPGMKWTSFFLDEESFDAIDRAQRTLGLRTLGDFADVDVGIVTGRNQFFVVNNETRDAYDLKSFVIPLVGKTSAINSLLFNDDKFYEFSAKYPCYLLNLKGIPETEFTAGLLDYIRLGEQEGVHQGYKCRIRKRWYDVPSTHISDGFLFRQIHRFPLLVTNTVGAACTDTIHRVTLKDKNQDFAQLSAAFVNSLTLAWSEICGRSYGGGVLELEPNEAEELPLPFFDSVELDVAFVNNCLAQGNVEAAMDYVDKKLLIDKLGLAQEDVDKLRAAWNVLSQRRINRK